MAQLKLQFIEGLPLDQVIRVALQIPSPFTLILHDNIFGHVHTRDANAFPGFCIVISIFHQRLCTTYERPSHLPAWSTG